MKIYLKCCSQSRTTDQMCQQQSRSEVTAKEALAAEQSLSVYCKPVEFYNILQRRAIHNPSFLQRCLRYKILAKHKQRIQMTISLSGSMNADIQMQNLFPLHVILAKPVAETIPTEPAVYRVIQTYILTNFSGIGMKDQNEAKFIFPEMKKLSADAHLGNLTIILASNWKAKVASTGSCVLGDRDQLASFPSTLKGNCFWGKIPIKSLFPSLVKCATMSLGHGIEIISKTNLHPGVLKPSLLDKDNYLTFGIHNSNPMSSFQVQVTVCGQEIGARKKSPDDSYSYENIPTSSLPHIIRFRSGKVLFNYKYYNNTQQKTEVTEDFTCPFCLVRCVSFKGLRYHLRSSHDLFNFEFWGNGEFQTVNVFMTTDILRSEVASDGVEPRQQPFFYRSKIKRPRRSQNVIQNVYHVYPLVLEANPPEATEQSADYLQDVGVCSSRTTDRCPKRAVAPNGFCDGSSYRVDEGPAKALFHETQLLSAKHRSESFGSDNYQTTDSTELLMTSSPDFVGVCTASAHASISNECAQPVSGNSLVPPVVIHFTKTRKLSVQRAEPRNHQILQKRQFFHSHRAQPMALEQVYSDRDSEDEVDDDIPDLEDRRMLDDFLDVTEDEKQIMHLWNSFVRKQRVLADGHVPWACEAFSRLHRQDLVRAPALGQCWRLFMVKLWNHSLLDARTMNNCNIILERYQNGLSDAKDYRG